MYLWRSLVDRKNQTYGNEKTALSLVHREIQGSALLEQRFGKRKCVPANGGATEKEEMERDVFIGKTNLDNEVTNWR